MVEIFRTNVQSEEHALKLTRLIKHQFSEYDVNFDLEDVDRILRIKSKTRTINQSDIVSLLNKSGFSAEVIPDDYPLQTIHELAG